MLLLLEQAGSEGPEWTRSLGVLGSPHGSWVKVLRSASLSRSGAGGSSQLAHVRSWTAGGLRRARRGQGHSVA